VDEKKEEEEEEGDDFDTFRSGDVCLRLLD
jgi:hypothetical protein